MNNYFVSLNLAALNNTVITEVEVEGIEERGIFIPFRYNGFFFDKKKNPFLRAVATERQANAWNQSHCIRQYVSAKEKEKMERLGVKPNILGNMTLYYKAGFMNSKKQHVSIDEALDNE